MRASVNKSAVVQGAAGAVVFELAHNFNKLAELFLFPRPLPQ
jgi:hypothetical protein